MAEPTWQESLPEELRDAPYIGKAESASDAMQKLVHAAKLVGTSIRIPGEDASEEDRAAFMAKLADVPGVAQLPLSDDSDGLNALLGKLGKPEDVAGYKLPEIADFEWDTKLSDDLRAYALEAGLTDRQFSTFAKKIAEQEQSASQDADQSLADARASLRQDWGETLEERESLIRGWMDKSEAPASLKELLNDRNLPVDTMNWLYNTAKQFKGEINPVSQDGSSPAPMHTQAEARDRMQKILGDLMQMRETDPRYRDLQQQLVQMQKVASGPEAA